jgi:monoamine oxidase
MERESTNTSQMHRETNKRNRRQFLLRLGEVGGSAAVYQAMTVMGLLATGESRAAESQQRWRQRASQSRAGARPGVVVLGAGIAGLTAAYELKKAGFPVTVIEARSRPGGRNHTLRRGDVASEFASEQVCEFDQDAELYFNAGPAQIAQHHSNLLAYCRELRVPLQAFINENRGAWIHSSSAFGGAPMRAREVIASMRGTIAELLAKAINAGALDSEISVAERVHVLEVLRNYGDLSQNNHFLKSSRGGIVSGSGGLTPAQARDPLLLEDYFFNSDIPFTPNFTESYNQAATMLQPVGGMDRIAYALADTLADEIYYGAEITAIRRTGTGVRIEGHANGEQGALEASYAIVAMPPSVLRTIPNDFSLAVKAEIDRVQYANPVKIAFQSERFWEIDEHIYGGISWTDPEVLQIWYPSGGFGQQRGIILGAYLFGGPHADALANLSREARNEFALTAGSKVHASYREKLTHGVSVAWGRVPFSVGGWSVSTPSPLLQQPDGPFLFAGDHLTYLQGWQEGAVVSSLNALANLGEMLVL